MPPRHAKVEHKGKKFGINRLYIEVICYTSMSGRTKTGGGLGDIGDPPPPKKFSYVGLANVSGKVHFQWFRRKHRKHFFMTFEETTLSKRVLQQSLWYGPANFICTNNNFNLHCLQQPTKLLTVHFNI